MSFHALRDRSSRAYFVDEEDISLKIKKALDKIIHFSNNLHSNTFLGLTGKPIKQIVNKFIKRVSFEFNDKLLLIFFLYVDKFE